MDYVTQNFSSARILPNRALGLPLKVCQQSKEILTQPVIFKGKLYKVKARVCVNAYREQDLSLEQSNNSKPFAMGISGLNSESMLIGSKEGKVCEVNCDSLKVLSEFDLGIIHTARTVSCKGFRVVMFQDERAMGIPIKVGRKNFHQDELAWGFEPETTISSFSVTDDEKLVVVTDSSGGISTLDIETGKVLWQKNVKTLGALTQEELKIEDGGSSDNPHIFNDMIVMGYAWRYLIGVDINTGNLKWKRKTNSSISYTTVDSQGKQYFLAAYKDPPTLLIVDCRTGESIKEFIINLKTEEIKTLFTSSIYSDVTLTHFWGVSAKGLLYAVNLETGEIDWHYNLGNALTGSPFFICNNRLYISTLTEQFIFEGQGGYIPD